MQDTQVKTQSENQISEAPVQPSIPVSRFDDAEYARWCEKLRNSNPKVK